MPVDCHRLFKCLGRHNKIFWEIMRWLLIDWVDGAGMFLLWVFDRSIDDWLEQRCFGLLRVSFFCLVHKDRYLGLSSFQIPLFHSRPTTQLDEPIKLDVNLIVGANRDPVVSFCWLHRVFQMYDGLSTRALCRPQQNLWLLHGWHTRYGTPYFWTWLRKTCWHWQEVRVGKW